VIAAPHFHISLDWRQRILLSAEGKADLASQAWRAPDEREVEQLNASGTPGAGAPNVEDCLALFNLPRHLLSVWWQIMDRAQQSGDRNLPGFDGFVTKVAEFLAFKHLAVPEGAACELLITTEQMRMAPSPNRRLWGAVNLGADAVSLACGSAPAMLLKVEPGEGVRLPVAGLVMDLIQRDKDEGDVLLMIGRST
jgi:hypothetical protein